MSLEFNQTSQSRSSSDTTLSDIFGNQKLSEVQTHLRRSESITECNLTTEGIEGKYTEGSDSYWRFSIMALSTDKISILVSNREPLGIPNCTKSYRVGRCILASELAPESSLISELLHKNIRQAAETGYCMAFGESIGLDPLRLANKMNEIVRENEESSHADMVEKIVELSEDPQNGLSIAEPYQNVLRLKRPHREDNNTLSHNTASTQSQDLNTQSVLCPPSSKPDYIANNLLDVMNQEGRPILFIQKKLTTSRPRKQTEPASASTASTSLGQRFESLTHADQEETKVALQANKKKRPS